MKVAIGYKVIEGPWGGGNRFVAALAEGLRGRGHAVVHSLDDGDIDVIIIIDPRSRIPNIPFGAGAILTYLAFRNRRAVVIHRINECDERKNTRSVNFRLRLANRAADCTVFVGSWLKALKVWHDDGRRHRVILNGADPNVFHAGDRPGWDGQAPLNLVTHHWGGNWMKGFDVYQRIDQMLADPDWTDRIAFTYIGNVPAGFRFENTRHLEPMDANRLADELRRHHVYVTASINEPGGNHQNEGALCGLPLIYRNSGCLPEYCEGFGVMFEGAADFAAALTAMIGDYPKWKGRIGGYPHTAQKTIAAYLDLIETLYKERGDIAVARRLWRRPLAFLLNQLPL